MDYVLRAGDLDQRFTAPGRPLEGLRAHQQVQRQRPDAYHAEVPVSLEVETKDLVLVIGGRIDGVLEAEDTTIVEEIKSTTRELGEINPSGDPCHWGQAKVYAYLLARERGLDAVTVRLTYCQLESGDTLEHSQPMQRNELETFFQGLIDRYLKWATMLNRWRRLRDATVRSLDFPFAAYRSGQRHMAVLVYRSIRDGGQALVQAPTGIGKTVAALFPALKALAEGRIDRIFFLTARNTGQTSAIETLQRLEGNGLRLKRVVLTAKDRICFTPDGTCTPEGCTYAKGHFDRLAAALDEAYAHDNQDRETIETVAQIHRVCPFEFSLELAQWADCIIADYNYAFDPRVYLKRFFDEENGAYAFLVDEAHNLVDRSRDMFSAQLSKTDFLALRREVKAFLPTVYRAAGKINTWMVKARKTAQASGGFQADERAPEGLESLLRGFLRVSERWLVKNQPAAYRELVLARYFEASGFLRIWERYDDSYVTCREAMGSDLRLKLFCLDPSRHLGTALRRCRAAIFFSATLTPGHYFQKILGCDPSTHRLAIPSPFPRRNLKVLIADGVATTYTQREKSLDRVVALIRSFGRFRKGNYLCFFPSYDYMAMVTDRLHAADPGFSVVVQQREMDDADRRRFLDRFAARNADTLVGFAVMGGIFGEGIDLVGERLSGAVIVSVGLPAVSAERDLIRNYFDRQGAGFDFAYRFPGINRVLQAAGRVIRTDRDRGVVLLVDGRFRQGDYRDLLPAHWTTTSIDSTRQLERQLHRFWSSGAGTAG